MTPRRTEMAIKLRLKFLHFFYQRHNPIISKNFFYINLCIRGRKQFINYSNKPKQSRN